MNDSRAIVRTRSLTYRYPSAARPALNHVDFDLFPGEYVAVLGANGSGKSTLLKCLVGLIAPDFGTVSVNGGGDAASFKRSVAVVLQNPDDQIVGTVAEEDVAFGPRNRGFDSSEVARRVDASLRFVGLESKRRSPPHFLSGGERQRLALAGALALESHVLVLDEAASMLDPSGRSALLDLLDRYVAEGRTVLHVTHSMEEAARARRVLVLARGRVVFDGAPAELFAREELASWGLDLPQALVCARALAACGVNWSPRSLDPDGFAAEFAAAAEPASALPGEIAAARLDAPSDRGDAGAALGASSYSLRFENVSHTYLQGTAFSSSALRGVDLSVQKGGSLAVVGSSGSGKSTLLRHGNAVLLPGEGRVLTLGIDTLDASAPLRPLRMRAALSVQNPESALFSRFVADDVAYGPRNKGLSGKALVTAVRSAMDHAGLPYADYRDRETSSLSGGEKRKAALAGVFALDAELYLLDEPSAALDPVSRRLLLDRMLELPSMGAALVATTHSMEEAARFERVAVMKDGSLVIEDSPENVFYDRYDASWGIDVPWTVAAVRALGSRGIEIPGRPLSPESLAAALSARLSASAAPDSSAQRPAPLGLGESFPRTEPSGIPLPKRIRRGVGIEFFRNAVFGQFLDRPSAVRSLPPAIKYLGLFALSFAALAGSNLLYPLGALFCALAIGAAARIGPRHLLRGIVPALPYLAFIVLFQFLFSWPGDTSRVFLRWGFFDVTESELVRGLLLLARFTSLAAALSLFSAITPISEAASGVESLLSPLSKIGVPVRDLSMIAAVALRFVPVLVEEAERIAIAQLSRGGGYAGKGKVRAGLALTVPLFLRSLERAETLAMAMELRQYGAGSAE